MDRRTLHLVATAVATAVAMLVFATSAQAQLAGQDQEGRILSDRFHIGAGGFVATVTTDAAFGIGNNLGTFIQLENTLGLDEGNETFRLEGFYRFKNKHKLDFSFVQINRDGQTTIDEPIDALGVRFQGTIATNFDSSQFRLIYQYSFANTGKIEAGLSAGLAVYDYSFGIEGMGQILDEETGEPIIGAGTDQRETEDILAPLPVVGAFINYAINHRVIFRFRSEILDLDIGDLEGRVLDARTTIDWFITRNFGIGGGISRTDTDVRDTGDSPFTVNYGYGGLIFYVQGVL